MKDTFMLIEDEDIGKSFQQLIEQKFPNSEVYWVKNGKDALQLIQNHKIKIVIFDQKLIPTQELGTNIMREIKKHDNDVIGIFLSAYSLPDDALKAVSEGIFKYYVNKKNIRDEFIPTIMTALQEYQINLEKNAKEYTYLGKIGYKLKKINITVPFIYQKIYVAEKKLVEPMYIFPEEWEDIYIINAGEEQCITQKVELTNIIKVEYETRELSSVDIDIGKIKDLISLSASKQISVDSKLSSENTHKQICEVAKKYKMPDIPEDTSKKYLTAMVFQSNQIFQKYEYWIARQCPYCGTYNYNCYIIYIPTSLTKYRKVNTYSDNTQETVYL